MRSVRQFLQWPNFFMLDRRVIWGLISFALLGLLFGVGQSSLAQPPERLPQGGARTARAGNPAWRAGFGNGTAFGPGGMRGQGGPGSLVPQDVGPALVDLIQRHVAPQFWAPRGGPGTIHYWRPGRALVVRATEDVHYETARFLEQLRQAGR